ncbi:MAG: GldG family protein [Planctomycetota bacterium]|nr:GldG family protein [Planctomycetota bacterium]
MATDKQQRDILAGVSVVLVFAVVIVANLISDRVFKRWDLTAEGRYSLSEPFHRIVQGLDEPLKLTYYISDEVPAEFEVGKRDILDKLGEVKTASNGRILLEIVDPGKDPKAMQALIKENPQARVTLPSIQKDKKVLTSFVTAIRLTYKDNPTVLLPRVGSADGLEYMLASQITRLSLKEKPVIAVYYPPTRRGLPSQKPVEGFEWIANSPMALDEKYDKRQVHFVEGSSIPPNTRLLILIRPKNLSDRARYEITRYLAEGGRVMLIANPWDINLETGIVERATSRLEDDIRELGVSWVPAFVCDESNVPLLPRVKNMPGNISYYEMEPHPYFVKVQPQNVDQGGDNPITRFLPGLVMPYTSAFVVNDEKAKEAGFTIETLMKTSPRSWTTPLPQFLELNVSSKPPAKFDNPRPLFLKVEGQFPCAWDGKSPPAWPEADEDPNRKKEKPPAVTLAKQKGMLFLFPCPEAFHPFFLEQGLRDPQLRDEFQGNLTLLLNVAENCALGEELVNMRIKRYEVRAINKFDEEGGDKRRNLLKIAMIGGMPLLVVAFALAYWWMRRGAQVDYERTFAKTSGPSSFTS